MTSQRKAHFANGGIGALAGAKFLIRAGGVPGGHLSILEAGTMMSGRLDGTGDADRSHLARGVKALK